MSSRNMQLNTTHCAKLGNNPSVPKAFGLRRFRSIPRFCNLNSNCYALAQKCYDLCYDLDLKNHSVLPILLRRYDLQGGSPPAPVPVQSSMFDVRCSMFSVRCSILSARLDHPLAAPECF